MSGNIKSVSQQKPKARRMKKVRAIITPAKKDELSFLKEELQERERNIDLLCKASETLVSVFHSEDVTKRILSLVMGSVGVEHASIMLCDDKNETLRIHAAIGLPEPIVQHTRVPIGESISGWVAQKGEPLLIENIEKDKRFSKLADRKYKTKSLLSVPLKYKEKIIGVLNVNNKKNDAVFTMQDLRVLSAIARLSAAAIENARLFDEVLKNESERTKIKTLFTPYVAPEVAEQIMRTKSLPKLHGEKKKVTVLFADIRRFTRLLSILDVESVVQFLNKFFTVMTNVIFKYQGTVDKFMGDAILGIFGAPFSTEKINGKGMLDSRRAVLAAIEMKDKFEKLMNFMETAGEKLDVGIGIGINTGEAIVGNIGSEKRMEYTAIGGTVNLASRLCGMAGDNEILAGEETYKETQSFFVSKFLGDVEIKGMAETHKAFTILEAR